LLETKKIIDAKNNSQNHADARRLLQWIKEKELTQITPRYLQQYSPLRDKAKRNAAIEVLLENYYLQEIHQDGKIMLMINPKS
jgi:hypothetical protein